MVIRRRRMGSYAACISMISDRQRVTNSRRGSVRSQTTGSLVASRSPATGRGRPVICPPCGSGETRQRRRRTALGSRTVACHACRRIGNERTGTAFNALHHPTDIVLLAVLWRLR